MPKLLHVSTSFLTGDPAASSAGGTKGRWVKGVTRRRSDFAVQCHTGLQRDERQASQDVASESFIKPTRLGFQQARFNANSGSAQLFKPFSRDFGIWICHGRHHTLDASTNQCVSARWRATVMAMRFKVEIDRSPACARPSLLKRQDLCVLQTVEDIVAFANKLPSTVRNDCADPSAGRGKCTAAPREFQCLTHEMLVLCRKCHDLHNDRSRTNS